MKIKSTIQATLNVLEQYGDEPSLNESIISRLAYNIAQEIIENKLYSLNLLHPNSIPQNESEKEKIKYLAFWDLCEYEMVVNIKEIK